MNIRKMTVLLNLKHLILNTWFTTKQIYNNIDLNKQKKTLLCIMFYINIHNTNYIDNYTILSINNILENYNKFTFIMSYFFKKMLCKIN